MERPSCNAFGSERKPLPMADAKPSLARGDTAKTKSTPDRVALVDRDWNGCSQRP